MENQEKEFTVKTVGTDGGGEYTGKFEYVCIKFRVLHETTAGYYPEENRVFGRGNRTVME